MALTEKDLEAARDRQKKASDRLTGAQKELEAAKKAFLESVSEVADIQAALKYGGGQRR